MDNSRNISSSNSSNNNALEMDEMDLQQQQQHFAGVHDYHHHQPIGIEESPVYGATPPRPVTHGNPHPETSETGSPVAKQQKSPTKKRKKKSSERQSRTRERVIVREAVAKDAVVREPVAREVQEEEYTYSLQPLREMGAQREASGSADRNLATRVMETAHRSDVISEETGVIKVTRSVETRVATGTSGVASGQNVSVETMDRDGRSDAGTPRHDVMDVDVKTGDDVDSDVVSRHVVMQKTESEAVNVASSADATSSSDHVTETRTQDVVAPGNESSVAVVRSVETTSRRDVNVEHVDVVRRNVTIRDMNIERRVDVKGVTSERLVTSENLVTSQGGTDGVLAGKSPVEADAVAAFMGRDPADVTSLDTRDVTPRTDQSESRTASRSLISRFSAVASQSEEGTLEEGDAGLSHVRAGAARGPGDVASPGRRPLPVTSPLRQGQVSLMASALYYKRHKILVCKTPLYTARLKHDVTTSWPLRDATQCAVLANSPQPWKRKRRRNFLTKTTLSAPFWKNPQSEEFLWDRHPHMNGS